MILRRPSICTTRVSRTHCARSLSGVQIATFWTLFVLGREMRGRSERIVGFELDHRPDDDAHRGQRLLERMELREQRALDAVAGLVSRPKPIAKRLDHVIGGDADVSVAALDHLEHALQHADDRAVRAIHAFVETAQAVEVTEELVSAVDEVNDHGTIRVALKSREARSSHRGEYHPRRQPHRERV